MRTHLTLVQLAHKPGQDPPDRKSFLSLTILPDGLLDPAKGTVLFAPRYHAADQKKTAPRSGLSIWEERPERGGDTAKNADTAAAVKQALCHSRAYL